MDHPSSTFFLKTKQQHKANKTCQLSPPCHFTSASSERSSLVTGLCYLAMVFLTLSRSNISSKFDTWASLFLIFSIIHDLLLYPPFPHTLQRSAQTAPSHRRLLRIPTGSDPPVLYFISFSMLSQNQWQFWKQCALTHTDSQQWKTLELGFELCGINWTVADLLVEWTCAVQAHVVSRVNCICSPVLFDYCLLSTIRLQVPWRPVSSVLLVSLSSAPTKYQAHSSRYSIDILGIIKWLIDLNKCMNE